MKLLSLFLGSILLYACNLPGQSTLTTVGAQLNFATPAQTPALASPPNSTLVCTQEICIQSVTNAQVHEPSTVILSLNASALNQSYTVYEKPLPSGTLRAVSVFTATTRVAALSLTLPVSVAGPYQIEIHKTSGDTVSSNLSQPFTLSAAPALPTPSSSPLAIATPVPTATPRATTTATPTASPKPTLAPTATPTATPTFIPTPTPAPTQAPSPSVLLFGSAIPSPLAAGTILPPILIVARDQYNNTSNLPDGSSCTFTDSDNLISAQMPASGGQVTFSNLQIKSTHHVDAFSDSFTVQCTGVKGVASLTGIVIKPGAPALLAPVGTPPTQVTVNQAFSVVLSLEDTYGNVMFSGNTTASSPSGKLLGSLTEGGQANGQVTFSDLKFSDAGTYSVQFVSSVGGSALTLFFNVTSPIPAPTPKPLPPARLALNWTSNVNTVTAGSPTLALVLLAQDVNSTQTPLPDGTVCGISVFDNQAQGLIGGSYTGIASAHGMVTFDKVVFQKSGRYGINASCDHPALSTTALSGGTYVNVLGGAPASLVAESIPSTAIQGQSFQMSLTALDAYANPATFPYPSLITPSITLFSGPPGSLVSASCTTISPATSGVTCTVMPGIAGTDQLKLGFSSTLFNLVKLTITPHPAPASQNRGFPLALSNGVLYLLKSDGLYVSTDKGLTSTFYPVYAFVNPNQATFADTCTDITVGDGGVLYLACGGVFVSSDQGKSYTLLHSFPGRALGVFQKGGILYVGTDLGLSTSTDQGVSFLNVSTDDAIQSVAALDQTVFASSLSGLYTGSTQHLSLSNATSDFASLAPQPAMGMNAFAVYALGTGHLFSANQKVYIPGSNGGLFSSSDGQSFQTLVPGNVSRLSVCSVAPLVGGISGSGMEVNGHIYFNTLSESQAYLDTVTKDNAYNVGVALGNDAFTTAGSTVIYNDPSGGSCPNINYSIYQDGAVRYMFPLWSVSAQALPPSNDFVCFRDLSKCSLDGGHTLFPVN